MQLTSRSKFLMLIGVFVVPVVAAYLAYFGWRPAGHTNYGDLIQVTPLRQTSGTTLDGKPFDLEGLRGKWVMVHVGPASCDASCVQQLYLMRQTRVAQGKEQSRIERLWVLTDVGPIAPALLQDHPVGRPAVVLITPDRGLTGGLVLNVLRFAVRESARLGGDVAWLALGRKGRNFVARYETGLVADFTGISDEPSVLDIMPVARMVLDGFLGDDFSAVYVTYAHFVSTSRQDPVSEQLLPIVVPEDVERLPSGYKFEPSPEAILDEVLPRLLELRLYQALLEAEASEHSARMLAMRNATDAAHDLVGELTLSLNKARQADITSELLDIAGGAEALRRSMRK